LPPRSTLLLALFALAAYPAWVRGGTPRDLQDPLVLLGLIVVVVTVWIGMIRGVRAPTIRGLVRWLRDPVFFGGLLLLGLLALQWRYAGRVLFFDPVAQAWTYTPPLRPGWPSAFTRPEAAEMLRWFFPAWAAVLAVRSGALGATGILTLWRWLVLNAAAVGILGIVQQQLERPLFPFTAELGDLRFFASFGYENHAASFFTLMAAVAAGIAMRDLLGRGPRGASSNLHGYGDPTTGRPGGPALPRIPRERVVGPGGSPGRTGSPCELLLHRCARSEMRPGPRDQGSRGRRAWGGALMVGAFAVNLAAAHFSLSRAGFLMAWVLVAVGGAWALRRMWRGLEPAGRVNALAGGTAILLALAMAIIAIGRERIAPELDTIGYLRDGIRNKNVASLTVGDRLLLGRAALGMARAQPAFGVGGWGFRYLLPYTLPDNDWEWSSTALGKANVHNDPLQFLAEFGGVGAGLMALCVGVMLVPAFRREASGRRAAGSNPVVFFALAGLSLVFLHSLIDLPFRCPAILVSWTLILAGLGRISRPLAQRSLECTERAEQAGTEQD
jgi:hypothetical protein